MVAGAALLLLFGGVGLSIALGEGRTTHDARILGIDKQSVRLNRTDVDVSRVRIRIDTGEVRTVDASGLIDALPANPAGIPVEVELDGKTINSVTYKGHTYGSGAAVAKIVFAILAIVGGIALAFFGIRSVRRATS